MPQLKFSFLLPPVVHTHMSLLPVHCPHFLISYTGLVHSTSQIHFYGTRQFHGRTVPLPFFISYCRYAPRTPYPHCDWYPLTLAVDATFCSFGSFLLSVTCSKRFPGSLSLSIRLQGPHLNAWPQRHGGSWITRRRRWHPLQTFRYVSVSFVLCFR